MLLQDILQEFLFDIQVKNYTERTQKGYKNNNKSFIKFLEETYQISEVEEIKTIHIKKYMIYLKKKGRKETYINGIFRNIRSFFNYCVQEGYLSKKQNPCLDVGWMKEPKVLIKTFNDQEIKNMIKVFNTSTYLEIRNKLIIMTLVDTGIRNLELCQLSEMDILETTILVHGKGNKERHIYVSPALKKIMIKYERVKKYYFKDKALRYGNYFLSRNGRPLTVEAVERVVRLAGERARVRKQIRCSPHTLRHYFSQKQLQNGLDVYSLSRLLGHESVDITKRYLQSLEDVKIVQTAIKTSPLMNL